MTQASFHTMEDGRRIAYRFTPGSGPALVRACRSGGLVPLRMKTHPT